MCNYRHFFLVRRNFQRKRMSRMKTYPQRWLRFAFSKRGGRRMAPSDRDRLVEIGAFWSVEPAQIHARRELSSHRLARVAIIWRVINVHTRHLWNAMACIRSSTNITKITQRPNVELRLLVGEPLPPSRDDRIFPKPFTLLVLAVHGYHIITNKHAQ